MSGFDFFAEIKRQTAMFNDPTHLPKPFKGPCIPAPVFDVFDDDLMHDLIGPSLCKPVQALLVTLEQWDTVPKDAIADMVKLELMRLREAVKEEFNEL